MRRWCLLLLLFVFPCPAFAAEAEGNLYILGITLNQEKPLNSYNWCAEEIEKVFREQGQVFHRRIYSRLVQGKKATHAKAMKGLAWLQKKATAKDLVVIYVGAHGDLDPKNGWGIDTADGKTLWGREIKAELAKLPCHVIIMIETCTSGGFAHPDKNNLPVPPNVTALCACSGKQSIDNELDMALAEGLYGRADFNGDGTVELDELIRYIPLRYKEWWSEPKADEDSGIPVLHKAKTVTSPLPLTKVSPKLSAVLQEGTWYSALTEKQEGDIYRVHLLGWSATPGPYFRPNTVKREFLCLPADGKPMLVEQGGRWYPARLVKKEGANYKVHYLGYNEEEVVAAARISYPFVGDPLHPNYPYQATNAGSAWGKVGPAGAWKDTIAGVIHKDRLYTVETSGILYVTDLSKGTWKEIGKPEFADTVYMFSAGDHLYTIETSGSLYRVNPNDGSWVQVGEEGAWKDTVAGTILDGKLYSIESNGSLYVTELDTGTWQQIGQSEFGKTAAMYAANGSLFTLETDGGLYRVDPANGTWARVGPAGAWTPTKTGAVHKGRLYTVDASGRFYGTDLKEGTWKQIGKAEFTGTLGLFSAGEKVYLIEKDGSLSWMSTK